MSEGQAIYITGRIAGELKKMTEKGWVTAELDFVPNNDDPPKELSLTFRDGSVLTVRCEYRPPPEE